MSKLVQSLDDGTKAAIVKRAEEVIGKPISQMSMADINMANAKEFGGVNEADVPSQKYRKFLDKLSSWLMAGGAAAGVAGASISGVATMPGLALGGIAALVLAFILHNKEQVWQQQDDAKKPKKSEEEQAAEYKARMAKQQADYEARMAKQQADYEERVRKGQAYRESIEEMRFDGKKPIEFTDETVALEEEALEETKFVLKGKSEEPAPAPEAEPFEEPAADDGGLDDVLADAGEEEPADDKPFDDEPFDAGVEADEDTDPEKYIQQLSGKLGQSLRQYTDDQGQPDYDLEKFAVNSVLSATHTSEMDPADQKDIINKVKNAGEDEGGEDVEADVEADVEEPAGEESLDFGEEPVEETEGLGDMETAGQELGRDIYYRSDFGDDAISNCCGARFVQGDICSDCGEHAAPAEDINLHESKKSGNFVEKTSIVEKLRLMENAEPMIEPVKPAVKPVEKPARPMRETERPFRPKRKTKTAPKAETNEGEIGSDDE